MNSLIQNQILENVFEVYACHPETFKTVEAKVRDLPRNWIVYPNEFCPKDEFQQADLTDEQLKDFIFRTVLPNGNCVIGEKAW